MLHNGYFICFYDRIYQLIAPSNIFDPVGQRTEKFSKNISFNKSSKSSPNHIKLNMRVKNDICYGFKVFFFKFPIHLKTVVFTHWNDFCDMRAKNQ
jgi:hypothetical protein